MPASVLGIHRGRSNFSLHIGGVVFFSMITNNYWEKGSRWSMFFGSTHPNMGNLMGESGAARDAFSLLTVVCPFSFSLGYLFYGLAQILKKNCAKVLSVISKF